MSSISRKDMFKLTYRGVIFLLFVIISVINKEYVYYLFTLQISFFKIYHVVWLILIILLLKGIFVVPNKIASGKIYSKYYKENKIFPNKKKIVEYTHKSNIGAVKSAVFWLSIMVVFSIIYFLFDLDKLWVYGFVIFTVFLDGFYIIVWCPYRVWLLKSKCCVTCRIYNWGYWIMFIPLILIPSFWNYSILALSLIIFLKWEYLHYKHPERFYELCNTNLMCKNCSSKSGYCRIK